MQKRLVKLIQNRANWGSKETKPARQNVLNITRPPAPSQVPKRIIIKLGVTMPCYKHHDCTNEKCDTILQKRLVKLIQIRANWRESKGTKPARKNVLNITRPPALSQVPKRIIIKFGVTMPCYKHSWSHKWEVRPHFAKKTC